MLDPPTDPTVVRELVDAQPSDFTDYLNFFEFVAFLARSGQLSVREVLALFGYYVQCLRQEPSVRACVDDTTKGYEYLRALLNERPGMTECLFVYGTLLPGRAPDEVAHLVRGFQRVGKGSIPGRLYDLGEYPGAIIDEHAGSKVWGEVFRLPDGEPILHWLDDYEGFDPADPGGSLFVRQRRPVSLANGDCLVCWVYVYNRTPPPGSLVPGGDYFATIAGARKRSG